MIFPILRFDLFFQNAQQYIDSTLDSTRDPTLDPTRDPTRIIRAYLKSVFFQFKLISFQSCHKSFYIGKGSLEYLMAHRMTIIYGP